MRYYKAMCNTKGIGAVCNNYWKGLKYSLEMYKNQRVNVECRMY